MHPWPVLLVPLVLVVSAVIVLIAQIASRILDRPNAMRIVTFPRTLLVVSLVLAVVLIIDYLHFQHRERQVSQVVTAMEGELSHISSGWPGTRYHVWFERPLDANELQQLAVLKTLVGRNSVVISFRCDIEPSQLELVRDAFPDCEVIP